MRPSTVHYGQARSVQSQRQRVLAAAYAENRERFPRGMPKVPRGHPGRLGSTSRQSLMRCHSCCPTLRRRTTIPWLHLLSSHQRDASRFTNFRSQLSNFHLHTPPDRPDAALSFLSAASGLMLVSVLQHLQFPSFGYERTNVWNGDFKDTPRVHRSGYCECRHDCATLLPAGTRREISHKTMWSNAPWLGAMEVHAHGALALTGRCPAGSCNRVPAMCPRF